MKIKLLDRLFKVLFIFALSFDAKCIDEQTIVDEKPRGFLWYKDEHKKQKKPDEKSGKLTPNDARSRNAALAKKLDDAIQVVLDNPSIDNAIKAQRIQQVVMGRSEAVSKAWVLAALLDSGILKMEDNQNVLHRELKKTEDRIKHDIEVKSMAADWGLLFYWRKGCIYCDRFAPIIKDIESQYGFKVLAVSKDGGNYGQFNGVADTGGVVDRFNQERVAPLLFLMHKDGMRIYTIARGITDADKIIENILSIKKLEEGKP